VNGSATAGADYSPTSGSVTWSDGDTSTKTITVPISTAGSGKQFAVQLTSVSGAANFGSPTSATVAISGVSAAASAASSSSAGSSSQASQSSPKTIVQIQVVGAPIKVFDHNRDQQEPDNIPDAPVTAWKESDGTVNLLIPHFESYRMRGADLEHLTIDPNKIYSSTQGASQVPENLDNYHHWMMGPYTLDGQHFYSLTHSEWYGCLLNGDCASIPTIGINASENSWANTVNSLSSTDGGASWQLNTVDGNHVVAKTAYIWTGSEALAQRIYLHAVNHSGMFGPSRIIKEGGYFYSVANYIHRDFSKVNAAAGVFEAPIDKEGYVIIRTSDVTNPNSWQAWTSGSTYEAIGNMNFAVFQPQQHGIALNAGGAQIIYDTNAQCYILLHTLYQQGSAIYYMTTKSLASPVWSASKPISGTATLTSDPAGPVVGFYADNYPSILDDSSAGYNYEFTSGMPQMFFSTFPSTYGGDNTARDLYRVQLSITYQ